MKDKNTKLKKAREIFDAQIKEVLKENEVLREKFKRQPESKEAYFEKWLGTISLDNLDDYQLKTPPPLICEKCIFLYNEDLTKREPIDVYCAMYDEDTDGKPSEVIRHNKCKLFEEDYL